MIRLKDASSLTLVELHEEIANSGEGRIYRTSKSGYLAKIYHSSDQERISKLQIMVKHPPADPTASRRHTSIAWPKSLLEDDYGQCLGFLMPAIQESQTLINVYNPEKREKNAAGFNWLYLHTTALNIATVLKTLHSYNYVVGDLKPDNLLVSSKGLVSIIDADSFQISDPNTGKVYRSPVSSPEYTPHEMFGKDFQTIDRSEVQDRFGLAIIIWLLLFGYHPFSGKWVGAGDQSNPDERIRDGHWMYGATSMIRPGPLSMPLNILHPTLQLYFCQCFDNGHSDPNSRPSAADWVRALSLAKENLKTCAIEQEHHYSQNYGICYWCERKQQLNYDIFPPTQPLKDFPPKTETSIPKSPTPAPSRKFVETISPPVQQRKISKHKFNVGQALAVLLVGWFGYSTVAGIVTALISPFVSPSPSPSSILAPSPSPSSISTPTPKLIPSPKPKLTQKEASNLIRSWQDAKRSIFAPPYDRALAAKLTTGDFYAGIIGLKDGSIAELERDGSYFQYTTPGIKILGDPKLLENDEVEVHVEVTDKYKEYHKNREIKQIYDEQRQDKYAFKLDGNRWKISSRIRERYIYSDETEIIDLTGTTRKTLDAEVLGENQTKRYQLWCMKNQTMIVKIRSKDDLKEITFDVISPNNQLLRRNFNGQGSWKIQLPDDGNYVIKIPPTDPSSTKTEYSITIEVV